MNKNIKRLIIFVFLGLMIIGAVIFFVLKDKSSNKVATTIKEIISDCNSNPNPEFTKDITNVQKIRLIVPPGGIEEWEGGKILKSHSYIMTPSREPIYAPIDSELYQGIYYIEEGRYEYGLFFEVSCEVYYLFDHVHDPVEKIKDVFPDQPVKDTNKMISLKDPIEIQAGELIGFGGGMGNWQQWDFGVYNRQKPKNFDDSDIPKLYDRDIIAECPFDYFPEDKKAAYYALFGNNRTDLPTPTLYCQP